MSLQLKVARRAARGDIRGDPGIFGDIFKGVAKIASASGIPGVAQVGGVVSNVLSGGEKQAATGPGVSVEGEPVGFDLPRGAGPAPRSIAPQNGGFGLNVGGPRGITLGRFPRGGDITARGQLGPAGVELEATPDELRQVGMMVTQDGKLCAVKDLVPNKSDYFRRDPQTGQVIFVPKGTRLVRRRRRNFMNMKAVRRGLSYVKGAKRMQKQLSNVSIRKRCK